MTTGPTPVEAYKAFAKAQSQFRSAIKDANNPFFKSKYADLSAVWEAVKESLAENGLMVFQPIRINETGAAYVETVIRYQDGTEIERSQCPVICKAANDPQAMGSAITYARRYSLASILGVVTDDDDGNSAAQKQEAQRQPEPQATKMPESEKALNDWKMKVNKLTALPAEWTSHLAVLKQLKGVSNDEKTEQFTMLVDLAKGRNMAHSQDKGFYVIDK